MGWTVACEFEPRREFFKRLLKTDSSSSGTKCECLKHVYRGAPWKGTLYTVWQNTYADGHVVKYAVVYLVELIKCRGMQERGWGYKDIEASCGPNECAFPLSWLTDDLDMSGYAKDWAERVRAFWAKSLEKRRQKRASRELWKTHYRNGGT